MLFEDFNNNRTLRECVEHYDLVVVGGGLAGICCAITAARQGTKVCLIQDRPVLGGNSSSEVRLWALGATSHMGNNNRWAREGGVINEILVENVYRNREGNPVLFDMVLLDKVLAEPNITLHLNTVVYDVIKSDENRVSKVMAFNSSSELRFEISGTLFADCSGDGIVSYMAGVPYRMGAEDSIVYNEGFVRDKKEYGELMGHTIFFYMKDALKPVKYVTPDYALSIDEVIKRIPKINNSEYFSINHHGCKYWWLEYGGRFDTIHDTEQIKLELWKVVYGLWGYIKNSGKFPEMDNYTLEWVGLIPGKRESRRFKGYYTLNQNDIIKQNHHYDAVAYGGWSIDLHPSDGVYASGRACNQWHSKGIFQIPFRCYLSEYIDNLMFAGRIMSASHVANGSVRVMCTGAHGGQAIGMAASLCVKENVMPKEFLKEDKVVELQDALIETGQFIPDVVCTKKDTLINEANILASSVQKIDNVKGNGQFFDLNFSVAQIFPVKGKMPKFTISALVKEDTVLMFELRKSMKLGNYTPDVILQKINVEVKKGKQQVEIDFNCEFEQNEYVFVCIMKNDKVKLESTDMLLPGIMTIFNQINIAVSNFGRQDPPADLGVDSFEFWCPKRRPNTTNLAFRLSRDLNIYNVDNLKNSYYRPYIGTNSWAADLNDQNPTLQIQWKEKKAVSSVRLFFDVDYDHATETTQFGHCDNVMPQCTREFELSLPDGTVLSKINDNYQAVCDIVLDNKVETDSLIVKFKNPSVNVPATVYGIIIKSAEEFPAT